MLFIRNDTVDMKSYIFIFVATFLLTILAILLIILGDYNGATVVTAWTLVNFKIAQKSYYNERKIK